MKRILVLGSYAESLVLFRGHLLREMADANHEVVACAPSASDLVRSRLAEWGVQYRDIPIDRNGFNPLIDLRNAFRLFGLIRKTKPELMLSYTIKPVIYGSICAWLARTPKVFSIITGLGYIFLSNSKKMKILRYFVRVLYRFAISRNRVVFFQNPDDLSLFKRLSLITKKTKALVVNGSGVDIDYYVQTELPSKLSFLLIARLICEKGIAEFANAARIVKRSYPDTDFRLVGWFDGKPSDIVRRQVQTWIEDGTLKYYGKVQDVRPYIAASSVFVLPSYREGTPRTVLEAMAMGRPIITTDTPGCRETVEHGRNGYLVPVKDVDGLVDAMKRFIRNPPLIKVMGRESRRIAARKYNVHKVNDQILGALGL